MAKRKPRDNYDEYKAKQAELSRERSAAGREIGPLPEVVNPERRNAGLDSLETFCLTYFPGRFPLPFSPAHRTMIGEMEAATNDGGLFCVAFMRGAGKTTVAECAVLRAILYGLRRFVVFVGATGDLAADSLSRIQAELESNDLLAEDFPEACYPIRRLERIHNRAKGQTLDGTHTRIQWTADGVILPTVAGAACSGAVIRVAGLTGAVRGLNVLGPGGVPLRPDLVVIDDAQTRESAKSITQTADRERIISDDVLGLAGPTTEIACIQLCTPIYPRDLAERFLDPERHPAWRSVRTRMMESEPTRLDLWDQYAEIRRESIRSGDKGKRATEFYRANREAMDAGAVVAWPERKKPGQLSGIQAAMDLRFDNPRGFAAEYQCNPEAGDSRAGIKEIDDPGRVASRLSGLDRYEVPRESSRLTLFIDCGAHLLWYGVFAWDEAFAGVAIDYGTWPRQSRTVFDSRDPRPGLHDLYPGLDDPRRLFAGIRDLTAEVMGRTYYRHGGAGECKIDLGLIDSGWETSAVYQAVRASPFAAILRPSKGIARTASARGVAEWRPRPGERVGHHWRMTSGENGVRSVQFDPDAWKSQVYAGLTTPQGGRGGITFWGRSAAQHELIAQHCTAEVAEPVTLRGSTFDKWVERPDKPDNHLWDVLTGAAVAASVAGLAWSASGETEPAKPAGPPVSLRELQAQQRKAKAK